MLPTRRLYRRGGEHILHDSHVQIPARIRVQPASPNKLIPMKTPLPPILVPAKILSRLDQEDAFWARRERERAQRSRKRTQTLIDNYAAGTPEQRIAAAKARAQACAQIEEIAANADLTAASDPSAAAGAALTHIRIDDLESLFAARHQLCEWLRERIKRAHAKIHWQRRSDGKPGYFNVAVHENDIPLDKTLAILCHMNPGEDALGHKVSAEIDSIIECGLFPKIKMGKLYYGKRCQRGDDCDLCNYLNLTDGLKMLQTAYSARAFNRGGNYFGITVAPRRNPAEAKAQGRMLQLDDWDFENKASAVYSEVHHAGAFEYPCPLDDEADWHIQSSIRRFLGAVQKTLGKLVKNGWLDGIRARMENRISFLPYTEHQHWHCVGSSRSEHDPQQMAEFIKSEVDAILNSTCRGVYADVKVITIPTSEDLLRWVKYCNKPMDLVGAVNSMYNRHPGLRRSDPKFKDFLAELNLMPLRQRMLYRAKRLQAYEADERGAHTYCLTRRYVTGNHKFGDGCVLTESAEHRIWRNRHAKNTARWRKQNP